jgi:hypothetical protein
MAFPNIFMDIEEEEEEDDTETDLLSLVRIVETLIETRIFRQTMENSMETYNNELFRRQEELCLDCTPTLWTDKEEEKKCYVCLEMFASDHSVVKLPCRHVFHHTCVEDAVAHQHLRCPLCREDVPTRTREEKKEKGEEDKEDRNTSGHILRFPD